MSIKTKIVLATTIVLGIVFVAFSLVIYEKAKAAYWGRLDARLQGYAGTFREEVDEQSSLHRFPTVSDFRDLKAKGLAGSRFRLLDQSGNSIVSDSLLDGQRVISVEQIRLHQPLFQDISLNGERFRSFWTSFEANGGKQYYLEISLPSMEVDASLGLLQLLFLIGVPIALILSAIAVYAIVVGALRPLAAIVRTANSITAINLRERIPLHRHQDEVLALASTLNTMMDRIEKAFASQKQFIADASHEIRTPLTIIRSELEYSRNRTLDDSAKESLDIALDEVDRLKKLSDDLLILARLESASAILNITQGRLDELLADCVRKMKMLADTKKISIVLRIDEAKVICVDEEKLRGAILNLIDNAIRYSHDGGTIVVSTRSSGGRCEVSVSDDGEGIAKEEIEKLFERFHRTETQRSNHEGSGLGLAIVRGIVELHRGTISVSSEPGKGSTFTISVPTTTTQADQPI